MDLEKGFIESHALKYFPKGHFPKKTINLHFVLFQNK